MSFNLDSVNTTGGHIIICLVISVMGAVLMWMGRHEPAIFGIAIGILQTGLGVAFRSMGMPNVYNPTAAAPHPVVHPPALPKETAVEPVTNRS